MQQKMNHLNDDYMLSRKRSSTYNNSTFEQQQSLQPIKMFVLLNYKFDASFVNTGVQTTVKFKDYKKKYKEMVEKVRNNEL